MLFRSLANQYFNPKNPESHYKTTGPEIWEQTGGQIDYFVCGVGTGGTVSGVGKYLKEKNPKIKIVGIDPKGSILREYFYNKKFNPVLKTYKVEGIGQDWLPGTLNFEVIDDMVEANDKESFLMARRLTREEGIFVGGSAGTAAAGALKYADRMKDNDVMVILLPDTGERVNIDPLIQLGFLSIPSNVPTADTCTAGGYSWFNFFDLATGGVVPAPGNQMASQKVPDEIGRAHV